MDAVGQHGGQLDGDPTVGINHDGRLEVFAIGSDGRAFHIYQRWFDLFGAPWSGRSHGFLVERSAPIVSPCVVRSNRASFPTSG